MLFLEKFNQYQDTMYGIYLKEKGYRVCYVYKTEDFPDFLDVNELVDSITLDKVIISMDSKLNCFILSFENYGADFDALHAHGIPSVCDSDSDDFVTLRDAETCCKCFIDGLWRASCGINRKHR